ncbi:Xylose isomerase OS=Lysinibacillus sphaericus OX=1421 GN=LS41612_14055 PE=4 SV=1 [Lysinibacillus sphaericus]
MLEQICFSDLPLLTHDIIGNVEKLIAAGAEVVELMMDGDKWGDMEGLFPTLAKELKALPVRYSIHPPAWDINITSENKAIREASFHEYRKAIEFASMINAQHVVIHPGFCFCSQFNKELGKKRAKQYIHELCAIAKPLNVSLAIENVGYNGTSLFTKDEFEHFLDDVDEIAGYLIDVGHANLNGWDITSTILNVKGQFTCATLT